MNLAVIGLGKLGLPLAALHAKTHRVYGVDSDAYNVKVINSGRPPIIEPHLPPLLKRVVDAGHLTAHSDYGVVTGTDMSLVIVPTPSLQNGSFDSKYVLSAVEEIGKAIAPQTNRHVVVICSTVMPGECDGIIRATLETASAKVVGENVGLVYSPEFIALGTVIRDMEHPAMVLIGESDPLSGTTYAKLAPPGIPVRKMGLTSAEIAKISLNAYVTMKISFANTLGEICENTCNADAHQITEAIGLDPRVGEPYIRPGGPFGGPCFPRDSKAFGVFANSVGVEPALADATDRINERQINRTIRHIQACGRNSVGILGLTYKPGAGITEEAFGINLALELHRRDYTVKVFDPLVAVKPGMLPKDVVWSLDPQACFGNEMTTVITNPDRAYTKLFPNMLSSDQRNQSIVIDCWDYLPNSPWDDTHIIRLGKGEQCS